MHGFNVDIFATKGVYTSLSSELAGGFRIDEENVLSLFGGEFNFVENRDLGIARA